MKLAEALTSLLLSLSTATMRKDLLMIIKQSPHKSPFPIPGSSYLVPESHVQISDC